MNALIIIDIQNDFMPGGALAVPQADGIVPVINQVMNHFDLIVATQDWHPQNHKSFASNHSDKKAFERIQLNGLEQTLWPDHCVQGSRGAEFFPQLETKGIAAIFRKGMNPEIDSYSGFYENDHKNSTGLAAYLRAKGASDLYFCGLCADVCVYYSVKDALREGFKTYLIEDAIQPLNMEAFKQIRRELGQMGVGLITSAELAAIP